MIQGQVLQHLHLLLLQVPLVLMVLQQYQLQLHHLPLQNLLKIQQVYGIIPVQMDVLAVLAQLRLVLDVVIL